MKIAIDVRTLVHSLRTGVMSYTDNFIRALGQLNEKNIYYLIAAGLRLKKDQLNVPERENFIKKILPIPDRNFYGKEFIFNSLAVPISMVFNKAEVFHVPSGYDLPMFGKFRKVITVHDLRSVHLVNDIMPQDLTGLRSACKRADAIIAISEYTKQDIIKNLGVPEKKIHTVYNGVDETIYKLTDRKLMQSFCEKYRLSKKYFFSLGLVPRKNIKRLIEAYSNFKYKDEFMLVLAGAGDKREYLNLVERSNLKGYVMFMDNVSQEDLIFLYNGASFFIFPSLYEGFGLPALEAQKCGVPVLSSNSSALPEVLNDSAVFFDPLSVTEITKAMCSIVEDEKLRTEIVDKGYKNIKKFTWNSMARQILEIYKSII